MLRDGGPPTFVWLDAPDQGTGSRPDSTVEPSRMRSTLTALTYGPSTTSHIIIITNDKIVATYCTAGTQAVWNVKGLEMDEAVDLFKMKVSY